MNKELQKIIDTAKQFSLNSEEKLHMSKNINLFIENNTKIKTQNKITTSVVSPYVTKYNMLRLIVSKSFLLKINQRKFMPIALILMLLLGASGTSAAAQNSLPGDILYPVKINVNEGVESLLSVGAKKDAQTHQKQTVRRLAEAEKLLKDNKLTPELKDRIKNNFSKKVKEMQGDLDALTTSGDLASVSTITSTFENELDNYLLKTKEVSDKASASAIAQVEVSKNENIDKNINIENQSPVLDLATIVKKEKESTSKKYKTNNIKIENRDGERNEKEDREIKKTYSKDRSENRKEEREDDEDERGYEREDDDNNYTAKPLPSTVVNTGAVFTLADISSHNNASSCYTAVSNVVYDLTSYITAHPGGSASVLGMCGIDGTASFMAQHGGQGNPERELGKLKIGVLK